jgi:hypothetical protein
MEAGTQNKWNCAAGADGTHFREFWILGPMGRIFLGLGYDALARGF